MPAVAWITGAGGLIGSHLVRAAPPGWQVRALTRQHVDLTNALELTRLFVNDEPDLINHSAAISKNPVCDSVALQAWHVNFEVTQRLCALARQKPLIFLSTDLLFDGKKGNYTEYDRTHPLSVYAEP